MLSAMLPKSNVDGDAWCFIAILCLCELPSFINVDYVITSSFCTDEQLCAPAHLLLPLISLLIIVPALRDARIVTQLSLTKI